MRISSMHAATHERLDARARDHPLNRYPGVGTDRKLGPLDKLVTNAMASRPTTEYIPRNLTFVNIMISVSITITLIPRPVLG